MNLLASLEKLLSLTEPHLMDTADWAKWQEISAEVADERLRIEEEKRKANRCHICGQEGGH